MRFFEGFFGKETAQSDKEKTKTVQERLREIADTETPGEEVPHLLEDPEPSSAQEEGPLSAERRQELENEMARLDRDIQVLAMGGPLREEDRNSPTFKPIVDRIDEIEQLLGKR
jgi:hypothetical protein